MKKKKIIFFANDKYVKDIIEKELNDFFEDLITVECYILGENIEKNSLTCDLVLSLTPIDIEYMKQFLKDDVELLQGTRTIEKKYFDMLNSFPYNTKAIIVNISKRSAFHLMSFLIQLGIDNIDFYPVYPENLRDYKYDDIKLCIIPCDMDLEYMKAIADKTVINLQGRRMTVETYKTMMIKLGIEEDKLYEKLTKIEEKLICPLLIDIPVYTMYKTEKILNAVISKIDSGVLVINKDNKIIYFNAAFIKMFNIDVEVAEFGYLNHTILPGKTYEEILKIKNTDMDLLSVKEMGKSFLISKSDIKSDGYCLGSVVTFKDTTKMEDMEMQLRGMIAKKGYTAKYTFDNIVFRSAKMKECIHKAKKIAKIDRAVLILGESGTGKEMFAQAIHNESIRKDRPFVAINCAALSSDLLESELFGYEEGTFTGARKGGKKGLLEMAHRGTIFLDEIGDMPMNMQVMLLRVLQEMEIRRLGGSEIIPIDVRVIAATNINIEEQTNSGKFRLDLYYRLSAFTIVIPKLKERLEDIEPIAKSILKEMGFQGKNISPELMDFLYSCDWKGNIRELKNCIEYMSYMGSNTFKIEDLPPNFNHALHYKKCEEVSNVYNCNINNPSINNSDFSGYDKNENELLKFILFSLDGRSLGRRYLLRLCNDYGYNTTEHIMRKMLKYLGENEYIEYGADNKAGAVITEKGKKWVKNKKINIV